MQLPQCPNSVVLQYGARAHNWMFLCDATGCALTDRIGGSIASNPDTHEKCHRKRSGRTAGMPPLYSKALRVGPRLCEPRLKCWVSGLGPPLLLRGNLTHSLISVIRPVPRCSPRCFPLPFLSLLQFEIKCQRTRHCQVNSATWGPEGSAQFIIRGL